MAFQGQQITHTFVAGESLTASQFKIVYIGSDGLIYDDSNSGARKYLGVLQDNPAQGVAGLVCLTGVTKLAVSGSTTTGSIVTAGAGNNVGVVLAGTGGAGVATVYVNGGIDTDTTA